MDHGNLKDSLACLEESAAQEEQDTKGNMSFAQKSKQHALYLLVVMAT